MLANVDPNASSEDSNSGGLTIEMSRRKGNQMNRGPSKRKSSMGCIVLLFITPGPFHHMEEPWVTAARMKEAPLI